MSTTLGLGSNMFQHAGMDLANDVVRPPMPIRRRPHGVVIPRCAFEPRASARKRGQQELAFLRNKVPVQVRRVDMSIRCQFIERRRTCRHSELQQMRLVPHFDWLDKRSCRENALPHSANSANAMSGNLRTNWVGDSRAKQQFLRRRNLGKGNRFRSEERRVGKEGRARWWTWP